MLPSNATEQCYRAMLPSNGTDVTDVRTNEEPWSPSSESFSFVTRGRAYEICPDRVSEQPTCPVCGATMTPRLSNRQKRTVCSKVCAAKIGAAHSIKRNDRAEDVADLLAAGESPQQIIARIGISAFGIARSLQRAGRHDLGRIFDRVGRAERHAA